MKKSSRDLLVLLKNEFMSEQAIEQEVECLNEILIAAESPGHFCMAHELVDRNRITRKKEKILKESSHFYLRPFRFLINRN
jgi:hypothetical protein